MRRIFMASTAALLMVLFLCLAPLTCAEPASGDEQLWLSTQITLTFTGVEGEPLTAPASLVSTLDMPIYRVQLPDGPLQDAFLLQIETSEDSGFFFPANGTYLTLEDGNSALFAGNTYLLDGYSTFAPGSELRLLLLVSRNGLEDVTDPLFLFDLQEEAIENDAQTLLNGPVSAPETVPEAGPTPESTEILLTETPVVGNAASIDVLWTDLDGNILYNKVVMIPFGESQTIAFGDCQDVRLLCLSEDHVTVTVSAEGAPSQSLVTFSCTQQNVTLSTDIECVDTEGEIIQKTSFSLPVPSSRDVQAPEIEGYTLVGDEDTATISVDIAGQFTPSVVRFVYEPLPTSIEFPVYYTFEGDVIEELTVVLPLGETSTVTPDAELVPDYVLRDPSEVSVTVSAQGEATPSSLIFDLYIPVEVPVMYMDATSSALIVPTEWLALDEGQYTVEPDAEALPEGYSLMSDAPISIEVADHVASPSQVIFLCMGAPTTENTVLEAIPASTQTSEPTQEPEATQVPTALVQAIWMDTQENILFSEDVELELGESYTFSASDFETKDYVLISDETVSVTMDEEGLPDPESVTFLYDEIAYPTVTVRYLDAATQDPVAEEQEVAVRSAIYEIVATPESLADGYQPVGNSTAIVTLDDEVPSPDVVTFYYSAPDTVAIASIPAEEPAVEPVEEPAAREPQGTLSDRWAVTNIKNVNIRRGAGKNEKLVETIKNANSYVWVTGEETDSDGTAWYHILYRGTEAYVRGDLIDILSEEESETYQTSLASPAPTQEPPITPTPEITWTPTPTIEPTATPTLEPTATPTVEPTATPTVEPTATPTVEPTATPTVEPTATPTVEPTATPTVEPTATPTVKPTATPTVEPTATPTVAPTATPTATPTVEPTATPTVEPTATPTVEPTATPTVAPTATPTVELTATPTVVPTATPTVEPTATPTVEPTATPTVAPTPTPTVEPTATPTVEPTATPTVEPTATPTVEPTATPTVEPTATPTVEPTATPTIEPTATPTVEPTATPTVEPTATPTVEPTVAPTATPDLSYRGFALTSGRSVLRTQPSGDDNTIDAILGEDTLVTVLTQTIDTEGQVWDQVTTSLGQTGYILDQTLVHITSEQAIDYLPASTPEVSSEERTEPAQITGYARILQAQTYLYQQPSEQSVKTAELNADDVVHVEGQVYTADGWAWHEVASGKQAGYLRADALRLMSSAEEEAYLQSQAPATVLVTASATPVITQAPQVTATPTVWVTNAPLAVTATVQATVTSTPTEAPTETPTVSPTASPTTAPATAVTSDSNQQGPNTRLLILIAAAVCILAGIIAAIIHRSRVIRREQEQQEEIRRQQESRISADWSARKAPKPPTLEE